MDQDWLRFYKCNGCISWPHAISAQTNSIYMIFRYFRRWCIATNGHSSFHKTKSSFRWRPMNICKQDGTLPAEAWQKLPTVFGEWRGRHAFRSGPRTICDWLPYVKVTSETKEQLLLHVPTEMNTFSEKFTGPLRKHHLFSPQRVPEFGNTTFALRPN